MYISYIEFYQHKPMEWRGKYWIIYLAVGKIFSFSKDESEFIAEKFDYVGGC